MQIEIIKFQPDDVVVLSFPSETLLLQHVTPMANNLRDALGQRVRVIPVVGCSMISVMRAMLPNWLIGRKDFPVIG